MSFFADLPEPPEEHFSLASRRQPDWSGPPDNVVGVTVPVDLVLANTGVIAVALGGMTAYPTGVAFAVEILSREEGVDPLFVEFRPGRRDALRIGVQFSDGRKVAGWDDAGSGDGPRLSPHGGGGAGLRFSQEYWLWPLPPEGPLTFACQWPSRGVDETVVEVAAGPIRAAAARAAELWPDGRPVAGDDDEW